MTPLPDHEIYAIKYGEHPTRTAAANFIGGDAHDGPMPLDYYVWLVKGRDRVWVVDTGFGRESAAIRGRLHLRCPGDGLRALGVDPETVEDVIVTHMHYDHCGNHHLFRNARFHLQDDEMRFATGRCMCHHSLREAYDVEDIVTMVRRVHRGQVFFHAGVHELAPGLSVHHVGGHTMGLQAVRVHTARGWVVLASDAAHLYANIREERPFPIVYNVADMMQGHRDLLALASSPEDVVPGHDPEVMRRFPAAGPGLEGVAVRLDLPR